MQYYAFNIDDQPAGSAKSFEDIVTTAFLLGLEAYFLGEGPVMRVTGPGDIRESLAAFRSYLRELPYDPTQQGDTDDDI